MRGLFCYFWYAICGGNPSENWSSMLSPCRGPHIRLPAELAFCFSSFRSGITILSTRTTAAAEPGTYENTTMEMERSRAWRRSQAINRGGDRITHAMAFKPEKNWKLLYTRGCKLLRARQLGISYPIRSMRQLLDQQ